MSVFDSKINIVANLGVKPKQTLEKTALALEKIIPGLKLTIDNSGKHEHFPAFVGELIGLEFSLVGEPYTSSKDVVGKDAYFDFTIHTNVRKAEKFYDVSEHIQAFLQESGEIESWILKSEKQLEKEEGEEKAD
ncbi:MAG TPA: hypothetical protein VFX02_12730 [Gammaproteobacteria bacterium]|nr:hypothetical protein [Gammaproteobacteria bacterium]